MKKMLMLATTAAMIEQFNKSNINILQEMGYEVHVAGNWIEGNPISDERLEQFKVWIREHNGKYFHIPSTRKPTDIKNNIAAYKQVVKLIEENQYEFIHCHTPIGSVIGRLAAHKTHTKIIYTAHGFHFYKGAPLINWMVYYPVERFLSRWTDMLITINQEDYNRASKRFYAKRITYIPGVGIDVKQYSEYIIDRVRKRKTYKIENDDFVIISVGEVNHNKNHEVIIRAIAKLNNSKIKYIICGQGGLEKHLKDLSEALGIEKQIYILGYCDNVNEYLHMSDVFAFPSKREGLGLAALEAMASGLPLLTSNIHGINDYSEDGISGYKFNAEDVEGFARGIKKCFENKQDCIVFSANNLQKVMKYDRGNIEKMMRENYKIIDINREV